MKAYKIELLVLDFENFGPDQLRMIAERARGLDPSVMAIEGREIGEWSDDHPLNYRATAAAEYARLFGAASPVQGAASALDPVAETLIRAGDTPEEAVRLAAESRARIATSSASGAKGAAVKRWEEREPTAHGYDQNNKRYNAMAAEIADWRALADRSPAVQPSGTVQALVVGVTPGMGRIEIEFGGDVPEWADLGLRIRIATPAPEQEAAQVAPPGAQEVATALYWQTAGASGWEFKWHGAPPKSGESITLYTAPVPATTPAEQPEGDSSHVMPRFAAPAGQHDAALVDLFRLTLGTLALHDWNEAQKIGAQYRAIESELASGAREGRDAQDESSGEGCATATNTNQPEGEKGGAK